MSCSLAGLTFTGNADSPLQLSLTDGAATASATAAVSSFGPGTFTTNASSDLVGTGLSEGSGYSTSFAIHGQANASTAVSLEGFAQVTVPHPSTLALLALGSIVWRIANRRRR